MTNSSTWLAVFFMSTALCGCLDEKSIEAARRLNCKGNLEHIRLAMIMYADIYGGRFPVDGPAPTLEGSMQLLTNVFDCLPRYLVCPSDRRMLAATIPCDMPTTVR